MPRDPSSQTRRQEETGRLADKERSRRPSARPPLRVRHSVPHEPILRAWGLDMVLRLCAIAATCLLTTHCATVTRGLTSKLQTQSESDVRAMNMEARRGQTDFGTRAIDTRSGWQPHASAVVGIGTANRPDSNSCRWASYRAGLRDSTRIGLGASEIVQRTTNPRSAANDAESAHATAARGSNAAPAVSDRAAMATDSPAYLATTASRGRA